MMLLRVFSLAVLARITCAQDATPNLSSEDYFEGLTRTLVEAGYDRFRDLLALVSSSPEGVALVNSLYTVDRLTIFAPTNEALVNTVINPLPPSDFPSLLAYHIATAFINSSSDVAPVRQHTIALTKLRDDTTLLPGNQTQVLVLESAPDNPTDATGQVLIRGDTWNASSVGNQVVYENLLITGVDRLLTPPSPLLETVSRSGLARAANLGATTYASLIDGLGLNQTFESCRGCTYFVPVNAAFEALAAREPNLTAVAATALLGNHVINGTVIYSPQFGLSRIAVTASGEAMVITTSPDIGTVVNINTGNDSARIIRSDIPIANGVVHLIDGVIFNTDTNPVAASEAVSRASEDATANTAITTGLLSTLSPSTTTTMQTSSPPTSATTSSASATTSATGSGRLRQASDFGLPLFAGMVWSVVWWG